MTREDKLAELTSAFNRMRAQIYNLIEGSCIPDDKQASIKRSVRDISGDTWNNLKTIIGD